VGNFSCGRVRGSIAKTWEGDYLLDPSREKSLGYLRNLFSTLCDWGYEYFKIDGQPIVIREYKKYHGAMSDTTKTPVELYRRAIKTIKETIGPERYLLGCWGIPLEGKGLPCYGYSLTRSFPTS